MSNTVKGFLKSDKKITRENVKYAASRAFLDEDGNPLLWEIQPIPTNLSLELIDLCTYSAPIPGKPGMTTEKLDTLKYTKKLAAASIVFPDLNSTELQDSYGVLSAEDLVTEMLDNAAEFNNLIEFLYDLNGKPDEILNEKKEQVKNS